MPGRITRHPRSSARRLIGLQSRADAAARPIRGLQAIRTSRLEEIEPSSDSDGETLGCQEMVPMTGWAKRRRWSKPGS